MKLILTPSVKVHRNVRKRERERQGETVRVRERENTLYKIELFKYVKFEIDIQGESTEQRQQ